MAIQTTLAKPSSRGFSLIEILVVVTILAILSGILLPVFSRAKSSAATKSCLANVHEIGLAASMYLADDSDTFPLAKDCFDLVWPNAFPAKFNVAKIPVLSDALHPYAASKDVFKCPVDSGTEVSESAFPLDLQLKPSAFAYCGLSYEYHTDLGLSSVTIGQIESPTRVNVISDLAGNWHGSAGPALASDSREEFAVKLDSYRYNVLFADFHAKNLAHFEKEQLWKEH